MLYKRDRAVSRYWDGSFPVPGKNAGFDASGLTASNYQ
jgi:hypothetical protein